MKEIMETFKHEDGILGCVLSGSGPTLLVISHKYDLDKIPENIPFYADSNYKFGVYTNSNIRPDVIVDYKEVEF